MKSRETAMRLKRREVEEKSRKVEDLQRIIREFDHMAADLDRQIQIEEDRTGVRDRSHFSYSTFAQAAAQRRDNLRQSTEGLREKLAAAVRERDDTMEQPAGRGSRRRSPP
jgi:flagellar FliJ protein